MKLSILLTIVFSAIFFTACGDDSSSSAGNLPNNGGDFAFSEETVEDLPACTESRDGDFAYVESDNTVRLCYAERWITLGESVETRDSLKNCTDSREGERAFLESEQVTFIWSEGKWKVFEIEVLLEKSSSSMESSSSSSISEPASSSSEVIASSSGTAESSISSALPSSSSNSEISSSSEAISSSTSVAKSSSSAESEGVSSSVSESSSSSAIPSSSSLAKLSWQYLNPAIDYGEMTDARDGQIYKTVKIGNQTWMAENLNYAYRQKTSSLDSSSFCYYSAYYCSKYGRLYLWSAAMDSAALFSTAGKGCGNNISCNSKKTIRGICPAGWHLPDTTEIRTLINAVGNKAGTALKSTSGWKNDGNGTDIYGFSAFPAGFRDYLGNFHYNGESTSFWSSTTGNAKSWANYSDEDYTSEYVRNYNTIFKDTAISVRCLEDSN